MHERTQERQDLQEELTALRRQPGMPSASGRDASSCTGRCRPSAATRTPAKRPDCTASKTNRAAAGPVPRGPGDRGSVTAKVDKVRNAGHADLVEATPVVAQALKRVAAGTARIRELLRERLPIAAVTPRSLLEHDREKA